ncbi:hypothetical protein B0T21DRAFT_202593 [Apiosordaria backusii]|uniref:Uncharacterized protein n=1 Tax=Apiosordaria backusii TaxID=314023 RepID=A0AA40BEP0_9PEZI|nr:hypothetical protein B0T21DRAFT_202593 [Apiosordaria backusii]
MGDFVNLREEPQRHAGTPPVGRPLPPHLHPHGQPYPVQGVDAVPLHTRAQRYHTGPVMTQHYGAPIIARHTRPAITPAATVSELREERSQTAEEMRESQTHWHVCRFERFGSGRRSGWEIAKRIDVPETSKEEIALKVRELNRTTIPVLHKLNELEGEVLHQINAVQKEREQLFGPYFHTEVVQVEDRVLVVEREKSTKERGRGYERDHKSSKHPHRSRHSERRSKSRGLRPARSRERTEERVSITAYYRTSPKPGVDLHMLAYGRAEEARPRTPPKYAYHDEAPEEGHVRFQQTQGFPVHHPQHAQHSEHPPHPPHPQTRLQPQGPPQHQQPPYAPHEDRQFSQTPLPPSQAPRNATPQLAGNPMNSSGSPAPQGRPQAQSQGYPQGQGQSQNQPHGPQQAQNRPPPPGQTQQRPIPLQQAHPQAQKGPAQRQTEYRGNGGPVVTVVQPSHKPGILKPQPAAQGLPQRRASFTPQFTSPPNSPGTDESLVSEVFSEDEEDYDSDTAVSMESFPEDPQFVASRKANNVVVNNIPPPPPPRFMESAAHHGVPPKLPRQVQQQQQQPQQRHVVKGRRRSMSNHMATERMYAPTPPPIFPSKQRPRVDVQEIRQNAYEAGRADAREEAIKLAERVAVAAVSSSAKPQIIIPERRHESPAPPLQQPVRRTTLPLQPPHSGVRRVVGMEARRNNFAQTPQPDRHDRSVDRRRSSLAEQDFDRLRLDDATEYVVEYGAGAYDSDVFDEEETYEERQRGSGVFRRSPPPLSYSPKAGERFRRPSVGGGRDREYETVRVRVGSERLPRREEEPAFVRDRPIEKGDYVTRHGRRDSGVDVGAIRFEDNPFAPRPGLAKRTTTYPVRYSREQ